MFEFCRVNGCLVTEPSDILSADTWEELAGDLDWTLFGHLLSFWQDLLLTEGYDVQDLSHYALQSYNLSTGEASFRWFSDNKYVLDIYFLNENQ